MNEREILAWKRAFGVHAIDYNGPAVDEYQMHQLINSVEDLISEDLRQLYAWPRQLKHGSPGDRWEDFVRSYRIAITGWFLDRPVRSWRDQYMGTLVAVAQVLADMLPRERYDLYERVQDYMTEEGRRLQGVVIQREPAVA